jgi:rare lipoprotein A
MNTLFTGSPCVQTNGVENPNRHHSSFLDAPRVYFGIASYYADRFDGRETANGERYDHSKFSAACNILPLGTWIRVTNLSNNKSVVLRTNDRLYAKVKRIVDLSRSAAEALGYVKKGLTQVKVEVIEEVERFSTHQ